MKEVSKKGRAIRAIRVIRVIKAIKTIRARKKIRIIRKTLLNILSLTINCNLTPYQAL